MFPKISNLMLGALFAIAYSVSKPFPLAKLPLYAQVNNFVFEFLLTKSFFSTASPKTKKFFLN